MPAPLVVVLSLEGITVDDRTIVAGQQFTVSASGFASRSPIVITLDWPTYDPLPGPTYRELGTARATQDGTVMASVRMPLDTRPGRHAVIVNGESPDETVFDFSLSARVTVLAAPGVPPTNTTTVPHDAPASIPPVAFGLLFLLASLATLFATRDAPPTNRWSRLAPRERRRS